MARELLTSRTIDALKPKRNAVGKPTSYEVADGGNLFLKVSEGGGKSWVFRFMLQKRRDAFGLGPYPDRTIDTARKLATEYRQLLLDGIDPRRYRDTQKAAQGVAQAVPTYAELVPVFLATRSDPRDWRSRLAAVTPSLGGIPVDKITFNHIRDALQAVESVSKREACRKRL